MTLQTEFNFTLPLGYIDKEGNIHKTGIMRMATAFDEIAPMKDPRVQGNPGYLAVILLSRVVTQLGDLELVNPKVIENLFSADFAFLEDLYRRVNDQGHNKIPAICPSCEATFDINLGTSLGEP
jgi:hypothetical protein